jgi:hypothetical protein
MLENTNTFTDDASHGITIEGKCADNIKIERNVFLVEGARDSVTDETAAIQTAVNAAQRAELPARTISTSAPIVLQEGQEVRGARVGPTA